MGRGRGREQHGTSQTDEEPPRHTVDNAGYSLDLRSNPTGSPEMAQQTAQQLEGRVRELFEQGTNFAHVAIACDGVVHTVITWTHPDDAGNVTLNSAEGRKWPQLLRETRRATVTVTDKDNPYEYASVIARLVEDTHDGADDHINALAKKYTGEDEYPFRQPGEQRIKFVLEPERISHYGG